ncbi:MAG TPA: AI-2E family transporter [Flavobacterium sp.]|nr:AI-2E family transporter [Flavobacterium sp.]
MNNFVRLPFYARLASVLLIVAILFAMLYVGKGVIIPVLMALLFAILVRPISVFMQRRLRFPNVLASMVTVLVFVIIILGILTFISWQVGSFSKDWSTIEKNITIHLNSLQDFLKETFGFDESEQMEYLSNATSESKSTLTGMVTNFILSFSDTLFNLFMIPIYMFLFLIYQNHLITFLSKLVGAEYQEILKKILYDIKTAVQSYLFGVLIQITVIATLTAIGLTIVGVEHALLLGAITGLLGLIPYLGNVLAGLITIFATLSGSPDLSLILQVMIVTTVVQLIDNNITVPLVVSSKVKINAFTSIIGIFIGGMLAGIAGMFLAIPLLAIIKVVFDNVPSLTPWGYLMGDDMPKVPQWHYKIANLVSPNTEIIEAEIIEPEDPTPPEEDKED